MHFCWDENCQDTLVVLNGAASIPAIIFLQQVVKQNQTNYISARNMRVKRLRTTVNWIFLMNKTHFTARNNFTSFSVSILTITGLQRSILLERTDQAKPVKQWFIFAAVYFPILLSPNSGVWWDFLYKFFLCVSQDIKFPSSVQQKTWFITEISKN